MDEGDMQMAGKAFFRRPHQRGASLHLRPLLFPYTSPLRTQSENETRGMIQTQTNFYLQRLCDTRYERKMEMQGSMDVWDHPPPSYTPITPLLPGLNPNTGLVDPREFMTANCKMLAFARLPGSQYRRSTRASLYTHHRVLADPRQFGVDVITNCSSTLAGHTSVEKAHIMSHASAVPSTAAAQLVLYQTGLFRIVLASREASGESEGWDHPLTRSFGDGLRNEH